MAEVESRLVTILFTDLEGSTRRWEEDPDGMDEALVRHDELVSAAIERHHGHVTKSTGDGILAVFDSPAETIEAAVTAQLALAAEPWAGPPLLVRMGIHTGEVRLRGGDIFGPPVNLAARIVDAAHGGQILVSSATQALARDALAPPTTTLDLGHWVLRSVHLPQHLFEVRHPELRVGLSRPRASRPGRSALPVPPSTFIAVPELDRLTTALADARLVTVTGPGGVGKSRLAIEVATLREEDYADGARWCPLGDVDEAELVPAAVGSSFDLGTAGRTIADIATVLQQRQLLVLVDNCDHVIDAVRALVQRILQECPEVTILATSREPLHVAGEVVVELAPLASTSPSGGAVALFLDRARATGATADDSPGGRARIARLCARLDGLPLAIELAASRLRALGLAELEHRLDQRFQLLTSRPAPGGSTPAHHQTLHRMVGWSYDLLEERERRHLARLAVFRGGCTLDAAEQIAGPDAGDTWESLAELANRSLVQHVVTSPTTRYALLETVRLYALERLGEQGDATATGERHARYFCALAEQADRRRAGPQEAEWVERELAELGNFRAAVAWAVGHDEIDLALRLYVALYELASLQGRVEIFDWLDPGTYLATDHELMAAALAMSGLRQDPARPASVDLAEQAIALQVERGFAMHRILPWAKGFAEASRGNVPAAAAAYREAAEVIRDVEGENGHWISARALVAMVTRDEAEARAVLEAARRVGQPSGMANALLAVARILPTDEAGRALELAARARDLAASVQNTRLMAYAELALAGIASRHASLDEALEHLLGALTHATVLRHHEAMWRAVLGIDATLQQSGLADDAAELSGAWIDAFPSAAARYPSLQASAHRRPTSALELGAPLTEAEVCEQTAAIVSRVRKLGLPGAAPGEDLAEEGRAVGT